MATTCEDYHSYTRNVSLSPSRTIALGLMTTNVASWSYFLHSESVLYGTISCIFSSAAVVVGAGAGAGAVAFAADADSPAVTSAAAVVPRVCIFFQENNEHVFVALDLAPPSAKRIRDLDVSCT